MDTSDPTIRFDDTGLCIYCLNYNELILADWNKKRAIGPGPLAEKIRRRGRGKQFDCIIGISGGLDSSFLTHVAVKEMGLRPLLFLSQIPDQDIPQDAVFFSAMYKFARQSGIKYVLTGSNYSLECVREPEAWGGYLGIDMRLISAIIRRFGRRKTLHLPLLDILTYRFYYRWVLGMRVGDPLNMVSYVKKDAERLLNDLYGWEPFQHKHHESRFTRFFEDFWLPRKFGFEKRRAHFSSMILTGQMARDAAIERLSHPELSEEVLMR
jgi:hypothetical protein